jgi:TRAP-type mannitol/chloroaromatic compound transport system permease large subunit
MSPPFGMIFFAMKGVSPPDIFMKDICRGAIPFAVLIVLGMLITVALPKIAFWLPSKMKM